MYHTDTQTHTHTHIVYSVHCTHVRSLGGLLYYTVVVYTVHVLQINTIQSYGHIKRCVARRGVKGVGVGEGTYGGWSNSICV